jgi:hypothetical protein
MTEQPVGFVGYSASDFGGSANNTAERILRNPVVGRKNYWSLAHFHKVFKILEFGAFCA